MYRPLSHNEHVIVSRTLMQERGFDEGAAASFFMIYKGMAMRDDIPEFEAYQTSEKSRLETKPFDQTPFIGLTGQALFDKLDELATQNSETTKKPLTISEWFFGDESRLDTKERRLRVLFYNSARYRRQVLNDYIEWGFVTDTNDIDHIESAVNAFHAKYPGTRQGVISRYEIFFGDPSGFSYSTAMEREAFLTRQEVRDDYLRTHGLPADWNLEQIKEYLRERALASGSATEADVAAWEQLNQNTASQSGA